MIEVKINGGFLVVVAGWWLTGKRYDETFWGDRNVLCLHTDVGYIYAEFVSTNGTLSGNLEI